MKTSLVIDDSLYHEAQAEARRTGKTLSETITEWAREGRRVLRAAKKGQPRKHPAPVRLGGAASLNLDSRRDWMDVLDG